MDNLLILKVLQGSKVVYFEQNFKQHSVAVHWWVNYTAFFIFTQSRRDHGEKNN